ncbi:endonuclease [Chryseobacterium sp. cx-311]|uniref:endonuclease/exonuclease/phosphatase family protein n=1 Tax=Marnyiella aurantia TaxID=2758037 RepID=UPI001AEB3FF6|nr:endonuclease/exonuclease/phosphatase family protein [Marnyiella aurantia]MBP0612457.1 endonuclease [Marnyiella aurantia]
MSNGYFGSTIHELAVFYNTENFYSAEARTSQLPNIEFSGLRNWDQFRFQNKLQKIAQVFQLINEKHGVMPMLIGLAEVQGEGVLQHLVSQPVFEGRFNVIHYESMDERGVDVALIYDKSKVEVISSEPISYFFEIEGTEPEKYDTTRDVLHVKLKYGGATVNVFVFHLPSKREKDINRPRRDVILTDIRERIMQMNDLGESVLLMGDFNENPDEENIKNIAFGSNNEKILSNPFEDLFLKGKFSTFHRQFGLLFDQMLISDDFFKQSASLLYENAEVFDHPKLKSWDRKFEGRPFRTFVGSRYLGGYSDHFPVLLKFRKN